MLNRLVIKGFKSIKEADLKLNSLNVLIGANGSGKSNLISLFHLINRLIEEKLQIYVAQSGGKAAPFFDDFTLRPNPMNKEMIQVEWREKESDAYFNAHHLRLKPFLKRCIRYISHILKRAARLSRDRFCFQ